MATGLNGRPDDLVAVLNSILDRLNRLEMPQSIHYGPIGGALSSSQGYTVSVETAPPHRLIITSDAGHVTVLADPV